MYAEITCRKNGNSLAFSAEVEFKIQGNVGPAVLTSWLSEMHLKVTVKSNRAQLETNCVSTQFQIYIISVFLSVMRKLLQITVNALIGVRQRVFVGFGDRNGVHANELRERVIIKTV